MAVREVEPKQAERMERILQRIIDGWSLEEQKAMTCRDGRLQNLKKDRYKAVEGKKYLRVQIIERQMQSRIDELLCDQAARVLKEAMVTGDVICFLDDDQKEDYNRIRGVMYMCMEVLSSTLTDMTGFLCANGMQGTCVMLPDIKRAMKTIDKWTSDTVPVLKTEAAELATDECDKLYEYIKNRVDMLNRKASRLLERLEKKKVSQQKLG